MNKATAWAGIFLLVLTGCGIGGCGIVIGSNTIKGSGVAATTNYALAGFSAVQAESAFHVNIQQGSVYAVKVTIDDNLLDYLDVRLSGDQLHIGLKPASLNCSQLKADVTMPEVTGLEGHGASHIQMTGFDSDKALKVSLRDASNAKGDINCSSGEFSVSGASRLELQGRTGTVKIDAANASKAELGNFTVKEAVVHARGASHVTLNVSEFLDATATDASSVRYAGKPASLKKHVSGAASVKPK